MLNVADADPRYIQRYVLLDCWSGPRFPAEIFRWQSRAHAVRALDWEALVHTVQATLGYASLATHRSPEQSAGLVLADSGTAT